MCGNNNYGKGVSFMKITNIGERKKLLFLILLGAVGILLVFCGFFMQDGEEKSENLVKSEICSPTMEYIESVENKIRNITEKITGSTDVSVIVSAESGTEYVYVSNEEEKGESLSREYITVKNESGRYELVLAKEIYPEIKGVSVACPGGDDSRVKLKILEAVSVALGISKNRICIVGTK
jgi:stage III sporulation protein AG